MPPLVFRRVVNSPFPPDPSLLAFPHAQFGELPSREPLSMLVARGADPDDKMYVFFPEGHVGVPLCKT